MLQITKRNSLRTLAIAGLSCLLNLVNSAQAQTIVGRLKSPDRDTKACFMLDESGRLYYQLSAGNQLLIKKSRLGIQTDGPSLDSNIRVLASRQNVFKGKFAWPIGENAEIDNTYRQLVLHCQNSTGEYDVIARVYNGSLAIRYVCNRLPGRAVRLKAELTEFNLANPHHIFQYHEESVFRRMNLDSLTGISDFPSTLEGDKGGYVSIGEADNRNYTKCLLVHGSQPGSLALHFYVDTIYRNHQIVNITRDTLISFRDSLVTPWRTISHSNDAVGLHNFSELNMKLVQPLSNETPSFVRPGKVFRVPIDTQGALAGIDFAARMNFQYILIDAGWYGAEFRTVSDPTRPIPGFDLQEIIRHGQQKGIGVFLYVNYVGLRAKIDSILPLYKRWGVSGLKFGFVDGGSQKGLSWLDTAMKKVNDYGFLLNVHDHYKPTGLSRRYPFQISQEGIRGDENSPDAFHNTVLPFTRFLAGAADFTFCYPNTRNTYAKNVKVSKGQQLALTVVFFDPLQAIFWYGQSQDYVDGPDIEFFKLVPTVWDESKYLAGQIGKGITVARRKGEDWYIGSAAGLEPWNAEISLNFLDKRRNYVATFYDDDGKNNIKITTKQIDHKDHLQINLGGKQGQAIIVRPIK